MRLPVEKEHEFAVIFLEAMERWRDEKRIEQEKRASHTSVQISGTKELGETVSGLGEGA